MNKYYTIFGQAYGQGNYGAGTYSCTTQQQQNGTCAAATTSGNGTLSNTGLMIASVATLACLLVFIALIVRFWRRRPATQEAQAYQAPTVDEPARRNTID